jgi:hypothetical protein
VGQRENDLNQLICAGDETSITNQKLIVAVKRIAELIAKAVPSDFNYDKIGYDYTIYGIKTPSPSLRKQLPNYQMIDFSSTLEVWEAEVLAKDIADGFVVKLLEQIESYRNKQGQLLGAVEDATALLEG